jgi:hypothetical protein
MKVIGAKKQTLELPKGAKPMNDVGRYILAATLFLCWAILLVAWNIIPAVLMAGKNYSNVANEFILMRSSLVWPLAVFAWFSFAAAIVAAIWAIRTTRDR